MSRINDKDGRKDFQILQLQRTTSSRLDYIITSGRKIRCNTKIKLKIKNSSHTLPTESIAASFSNLNSTCTLVLADILNSYGRYTFIV